MMGNGSTAGPLSLEIEEKNVVRVIGNEDPPEKRLIRSQLICHYFVHTYFDSQGSDLGENMGRGTGDLGESISVHAYRSSR